VKSLIYPIFNNKKILLIEDDASVRNLTERILSDKNFLVSAASNAKEAMELFIKHGGEFDLVFSDVVLPDESGPELVSRLIKINPAVKILFTSGYTDDKSQFETIQNRGFPFIQKPYTTQKLGELLNNLLFPLLFFEVMSTLLLRCYIWSVNQFRLF